MDRDNAEWQRDLSVSHNKIGDVLQRQRDVTGALIAYDACITKRRTHSLFRQGCMLYDLIPTMPEQRLLPLVERFAEMLAEVPLFADTFGAV